MAASFCVSQLFQFQSNPLRRNHHTLLLSRPPPAAASVACKSRIGFSRRIIKPRQVKCCSFSVDDDLQVIPENHIFRAIYDIGSSYQLWGWEGVTALFLSAFVFEGPMPPAALLVTVNLVLLQCLALFTVMSGEVPWIIHENTRSVIKLQVGLLGMRSSFFQKKLHHISQVVDSSTYKGLNYVTTELSMALLRHIEYCTAGYSSVDVKGSSDEWKKQFLKLYVEERGKPNIKNIWIPSSFDHNYNNEDIVVTILVAVKGLHKVPSINSTRDLKEALLTIASILAGDTLVVEVFWKPRNENDMFFKDYPLLKRL